MKGFHFRLESVLSLRRHKEEMRQTRLAQSLRSLEAEKNRLESIENNLKMGLARLAANVQPGELDIGAIGLESSYLQHMEAELREQRKRVEAWERQVAEDIDALLKASRDRKALEKLKESWKTAFLREATRKEQNGAEEIAMTRYLINQGAEVD